MLSRLIYIVIAFAVLGHGWAQGEEASRPRLVLVGDSTVKNGRGDGAGGMWGWGQVLEQQFDTERIVIENRALGGRSSRTYITEGLWDQSLARLRPGDFVLIQFGHNDGGEQFKGDRPRASLKGNGEETKTGVVEMTGKEETVHSYGWYLRQYVADAKARGATPIVLSLIPRNIWKDGRIVLASNDYGKWAAEAARQSGGLFIDLNDIVAKRYEAAGEKTVRRDYFTAADHTHTTKVGAKVNAECVVEGIQSLVDCPLRGYLRPIQEKTSKRSYDFEFGAIARVADSTLVPSNLVYLSEVGYGFEPNSRLRFEPGCVGNGPFYFSMRLPEGNYRVTAKCGSADGGPLSIKSELRRLMVEGLCVTRGRSATVEFTVNVRRPNLPDGSAVGLKEREKTSEAWAWDDRLTLEFNGNQPVLTALSVRPEPDAITVYLAGDSTVCDQPFEPWNSWGQMLPRFFRLGVAIANHAESGESLRSFVGEQRVDKIFSQIRPSDYLFVQFGHNDMKDKSPNALETFRSALIDLVERTRKVGAHPVLITSMERKAGVDGVTLGQYPQTVRDVARELQVPLIDLNEASARLYHALGSELDAAFQDDTHHTTYGSYLIALCVAQGLRECGSPLAAWLKDDVGAFDPSYPLKLSEFCVPPSRNLDPALTATRSR